MMRRVMMMPVLMALMCLQQAAHAQPSSPTSPKGAEVRLVVTGGARAATVKGELLAVDSTQVWLVVDHRNTTVSRTSVTGVKVRAHTFGGKRGLLIGLVGGIVTSIGMGTACNSAEDATGCGSFVAAWGGIWLLVTAISAAFLEGNSWDTLPPADWSRVAAYARYPQGVPPSLTAEPFTPKR
jgi:hypothetical protein